MINIIKSIISNPKLLFTYFKLFLIYKKTRFQLGRFSMLGKKFTFIDSVSFVFMYLDIFINKSYKFKANSSRPVILDCGANIGLSILYFKTLYPEAVIKAFEPDSEIFKVLAENCNKFNLKNVELLNKGVWIDNKDGLFLSDGADGGKIINDSSNCEFKKIEMTRLKDILEREKEIDLLKIDIEGSEYAVLNDCRESLGAVRLLFVEYHSSEKEEQTLNGLLDILKQAGFRYYINNVNYRSQNYFLDTPVNSGFDLQLNIYAVKE